MKVSQTVLTISLTLLCVEGLAASDAPDWVCPAHNSSFYAQDIGKLGYMMQTYCEPGHAPLGYIEISGWATKWTNWAKTPKHQEVFLRANYGDEFPGFQQKCFSQALFATAFAGFDLFQREFLLGPLAIDIKRYLRGAISRQRLETTFRRMIAVGMPNNCQDPQAKPLDPPKEL